MSFTAADLIALAGVGAAILIALLKRPLDQGQLAKLYQDIASQEIDRVKVLEDYADKQDEFCNVLLKVLRDGGMDTTELIKLKPSRSSG